jgi:hypothetical protein
VSALFAGDRGVIGVLVGHLDDGSPHSRHSKRTVAAMTRSTSTSLEADL